LPPRPLTASKATQLLIFADSGWGKTRLAGTSTRDENNKPKHKVLLIRPPVDHTDSILSIDKPFCQEWITHDWSEMDEVHEHLRHEGNQWDWVWFDSASAYQEVGLDDLWDTIITEKPHRKRHGMDKGDYWINMQRMGRKLREFVTISNSGAFNFGITAWIADMAPSEDEEKPRKLMPYIQGKNMASKTCGYMNVVGFGEFTDKGTRVLRFMETDRYYAKTDFDDASGPGSFAANKYKLLNPTMPKIEDMIKKSVGRPQRAARTKTTTTRRTRRTRR